MARGHGDSWEGTRRSGIMGEDGLRGSIDRQNTTRLIPQAYRVETSSGTDISFLNCRYCASLQTYHTAALVHGPEENLKSACYHLPWKTSSSGQTFTTNPVKIEIAVGGPRTLNSICVTSLLNCLASDTLNLPSDTDTQLEDIPCAK